MAQDYNNVIKGYRVQTQIPLDVKTYAANEDTLKYLGVGDNLAFTYIQGLIVYCIEEETRWEWREVKNVEPVDGLLAVDFTYPDNLIVFGIDYSLRSFNFFPSSSEGAQGPAGSAGSNGAAATITLGTVTTGAAGSNVIITNVGTSSAAVFNFTIPRGDQGVPGVDASNNLQKTITASYVLTDADNNYTILINNGATPINITVPSGLLSKINIGFIQQGSGDVTFVQSGTVINSPSSMKKIKGQHYNAYLEQVVATNVYQLVGNLKA